MKEEIKQEEVKQGVLEKGKLSQDALANLMNKHKVIEIILQEDNGAGMKHYVYFKRPSIQTLSAMGKISKSDEVKGMQIFISDCFLAGSKDWEDDGMLFTAMVGAVGNVFGSIQVSIKNL